MIKIFILVLLFYNNTYANCDGVLSLESDKTFNTANLDKDITITKKFYDDCTVGVYDKTAKTDYWLGKYETSAYSYAMENSLRADTYFSILGSKNEEEIKKETPEKAELEKRKKDIDALKVKSKDFIGGVYSSYIEKKDIKELPDMDIKALTTKVKETHFKDNNTDSVLNKFVKLEEAKKTRDELLSLTGYPKKGDYNFSDKLTEFRTKHEKGETLAIPKPSVNPSVVVTPTPGVDPSTTPTTVTDREKTEEEKQAEAKAAAEKKTKEEEEAAKAAKAKEAADKEAAVRKKLEDDFYKAQIAKLEKDDDKVVVAPTEKKEDKPASSGGGGGGSSGGMGFSPSFQARIDQFKEEREKQAERAKAQEAANRLDKLLQKPKTLSSLRLPFMTGGGSLPKLGSVSQLEKEESKLPAFPGLSTDDDKEVDYSKYYASAPMPSDDTISKKDAFGSQYEKAKRRALTSGSDSGQVAGRYVDLFLLVQSVTIDYMERGLISTEVLKPLQ